MQKMNIHCIKVNGCSMKDRVLLEINECCFEQGAA